MRLINFQSASGPRLAGLRGNDYVDLSHGDPEIPGSMLELLALGETGLRSAAKAIANGPTTGANAIRFLPPVTNPQKVICVGLNYADHARETGAEPPSEPVIFSKFATALIGHNVPIELPANSDKVDYEAELVVVIGRTGKNIPVQNAMDYVAGYCCGHDVSARDWQKHKPGGQWLLGKSFDTFAPLGPELVTKDEIADPNRLRVQLRLNGQTMQDSNTSQFIFRIDELIAYVSTVCTLAPGDLIYTGTPPGVGVARKPPVYLKPGDTVEVEIEVIGRLSNPVVAAKAG